VTAVARLVGVARPGPGEALILNAVEDVDAGRYDLLLDGDRLASLEMEGQEVYAPDGAARLNSQHATLLEAARVDAAAAAEVVDEIAAALPLKSMQDPAFPSKDGALASAGARAAAGAAAAAALAALAAALLL
jgi:hypothetical protein